MKNVSAHLILIGAAVLLATNANASPARGYGPAVVNGVRLSPGVQMQLRIPSGRYWYDRQSGLWGVEGGPTRGVIRAGLRVGGRLKSNASRGRSNVYINGRRLQWSEVRFLKRLTGRVPAGRYWLDAFGNVGRVGQPALVNLRSLANRAQRSRRSDGYFRRYNGSTGTNIIAGPGVIGITTKVGNKRVSWIR